MTSSRLVAYVAVSALLAVCEGQQVLDGAEEFGLMGSMRQQMNVVPMQRGPLFRGQIIADENEAPGLHLPPKMKREAPALPTAPASDKSDPIASVSSAVSGYGDQLKDLFSKAGQQVQSYRDQLSAQAPKRARRQAVAAPAAASPAGRAPGAANSQLTEAGHTLLDRGSDVMERMRIQGQALREQVLGEGAATVERLNAFRESMRNGAQEIAKPLLPKRERRQAAATPPKTLAGQASGEVNSPLASFGQQLSSQGAALGEQLRSQGTALGEQLRNQGAAAVAQLQTFGQSLVNSAQQQQAATPQLPQLPKRARRQISYPSLEGKEQTSPAAVEKSAQRESGGIMKYLSDLGQQAQQAQAIQQFLQAAGASGSTPAPSSSPLSALSQAASSFSSSSSSSPASSPSSLSSMMSQLNELIKSTQERSARLLQDSQRSLETTNQQTVEAAKSAQGGIQQALSEMGQGLQRLAANNPNLVPDIKNLYQTVSARLSSASSSAAQAAGSGQPEPVASLPVAQS